MNQTLKSSLVPREALVTPRGGQDPLVENHWVQRLLNE